jgi:hypothetical protein
VKVRAKVAALLEPKPTPETERVRKAGLHEKPYWDVERARIDDTRKVPVELVVNGPVFVLVDGKPVRASKRSAEWCLKAIDRCWQEKSPRIREKERPEAEAAYNKAREDYKKVLAESVAD